jgi:hypothetical protein
MTHEQIGTVTGVDFSGALLAGRNAWIADTEVDGERLHLKTLQPLEKLATVAERGPALAALVEAVKRSSKTLWAMDFPFGLPIDLGFGDWSQQLERVASWDGDARSFGRHCVETCQAKLQTKHVRRVTDTQTKTPFDCYHYRIIYQTFHGMRDVLRPLSRTSGTAILPFQPRRMSKAERVVVEACPSSTLRRLGLPHQRYKQPTKKVVDKEAQAVRKTILRTLEDFIEIDGFRQLILDNPGGDALDAVVSAVGGWHGWQSLGPGVAEDEHYRYEGRVYA